MPIKIHKTSLSDTEKKYLSDDDQTLDDGFVAGTYIKSSQVNAALHQLTIAAKALLEAVGSDKAFDATASDTDVNDIAATILTNIQNIKVNSATSADTATKLSTGTVGSTTMPVYVNNGEIKECSTYGGGTKVTLNDTDKAGTSVKIYAPTSSGAANATCVMNSGGGNPVWKELFDQDVTISANNSTAIYNNTTIYYVATNSGCINDPLHATYTAANASNWITSASCIVKRSLMPTDKISYTYHGRITLNDSAMSKSDIWLRLQLATFRSVKYVHVTPTFKTSSTLNGNGRTMPYVVCNDTNTVYIGKDTADAVFDGFTFEIICQ